MDVVGIVHVSATNGYDVSAVPKLPVLPLCAQSLRFMKKLGI